jgi:hypothetical protein
MATDKETAVQIVEKEVAPLVQRAQAIAVGVVNDEGCATAEQYLLNVSTKKKFAVEVLDPFRKVAFAAYQATLDEIKKWTDPLDRARAVVEPVVFTFRQNQEHQRQAEERLLQEAEKKRLEDEAIRRAEAAAIAGDEVAANAIMEQPIVAPKPVLPAAPKTNGVASVQRWSAEVYDLRALVKAALDYPHLLSCLKADMQVLDSYARSQKAQMSIPGVKAVPTGGLRIGGRKAA